MASSGGAPAGGGGRPEVGGAAGGMRHLGLAFTYNTLLVEYVLSKPDAEKDVGRTRLAQIMCMFGGSVLSKITSNKTFMFALSVLKEKNMKSEWDNLIRLRDLVERLCGIVRRMRQSVELGRDTKDDFELANMYIEMIIESLETNYAAFFPKQTKEHVISANLYGNLLMNSKTSNRVLHNMAQVPSNKSTRKGGRRRRSTKRRKN
jgi:hypothetical protein